MLKKSFLRLFIFVCFSTQTLTAQNLELLAHLPFPGATLAGCWHHVDSFGNEYALVGTSLGLSIVDLNEPTQPKTIFDVPSLANNWREVKTWAGFAYFGSEAPGSGITIVDLRHLPDTIFTKVWKGDGLYENMIQSSHAVQAEDGWLYILGGSSLTNGAIICSLQDPWNPVVTGSYSAAYFHDAFIRGDVMFGSEIYNGQFSVIDISDRANPVLLQTQQTPGQFNHNAWLSDDNKTLFTTDERTDAPLAAFNISDLENIQLLDTYKPSQNPSREVHNVRGLGNFLVNPSYGGQLTVVDATHPDNLIETAFASLGTSLVWDADPYLPSGIIFATAKNEGLFIFNPTYQQAAYLEGAITDAATGDSLVGATITVVGTPQTEISRPNGIYKTGAAEAGTYTVTVEKPGFNKATIPGVELKKGLITVVDAALEKKVVSTKGVVNQALVSVSPTLFDRCLNIRLPENSIFSGEKTQVQVSDFNGKIIAETGLAGADTEICLDGNLPSGQYLVVLRNENGISVPTRIIKG